MACKYGRPKAGKWGALLYRSKRRCEANSSKKEREEGGEEEEMKKRRGKYGEGGRDGEGREEERRELVHLSFALLFCLSWLTGWCHPY